MYTYFIAPKYGAVMRDWRGWLLVVAGAIAGVFYANFIFDVILPGAHDWSTVVSKLATTGSDQAQLQRVTDVVSGALVLSLLPFVAAALPVRSWLGRIALWSTAIFAIGTAIAGAVPLPSGEGAGAEVQQWVHNAASIGSLAAIFVGALAMALDARDHGPRWVRSAAWLTFWFGGVVGSILFGGFTVIAPFSWQVGVSQRFQIVVVSLWLVCLAIFAAMDGLGPRTRPKSKRG